MSSATADFIVQHVRQHPESLLCFPSGDTPTETLRLLVDRSRSGEVDFSRCSFVGLDEWVGMDKTVPGSCEHYVEEHFFKPAGIKHENIRYFNAKAKDLDRECKRIDDFIFERGPIDVIVVGVGLNGHIGLNEPGTSPNLYSHHVTLDIATKQSAQKYFADINVLTEGITLGIQHMMEAKTMIVIANGKKKAEIIEKIIEGPVTEHVPGSILQKHSNCYFFLDSEAASALKKIS